MLVLYSKIQWLLFLVKVESKAITETTGYYMTCLLPSLSVLIAYLALSHLPTSPATLTSLLFLQFTKHVLPPGVVLAIASAWNVLPLDVCLT